MLELGHGVTGVCIQKPYSLSYVPRCDSLTDILTFCKVPFNHSSEQICITELYSDSVVVL